VHFLCPVPTTCEWFHASGHVFLQCVESIVTMITKIFLHHPPELNSIKLSSQWNLGKKMHKWPAASITPSENRQERGGYVPIDVEVEKEVDRNLRNSRRQSCVFMQNAKNFAKFKTANLLCNMQRIFANETCKFCVHHLKNATATSFTTFVSFRSM
jgi:hypothetical protein